MLAILYTVVVAIQLYQVMVLVVRVTKYEYSGIDRQYWLKD